MTILFVVVVITNNLYGCVQIFKIKSNLKYIFFYKCGSNVKKNK